MCPFSHSDGCDLPRPFDELVPGLAAMGEDVVVGLEDPVGEPVVAHELPDVFDRVKFVPSTTMMPGCPIPAQTDLHIQQGVSPPI